MNVRTVLIGIVIGLVVVGFLGYTKPGHQLLNTMGLAAACDGGSCN